MIAGYINLLRPLNCLMTAIAVFIGGLIVSAGFIGQWTDQILLAMVAAFLIAGAGNAVNDYTDVQADKINRPYRPIPSGKVSKRRALVFTIALFAIGIFLAGLINYVTFAIAAFNSFLLVVYSTHLQNKMLLGNLAVSYLVASGFLFGGAALDNLILPVLLALLAGLANMAREIIKDLEDIEGDRLSFLKRIAKSTVKKLAPELAERFNLDGHTARLRYSNQTLSTLAVLFLLLAIAVSPLPNLMGILGVSYLVILVFADMALLIAAAFAAKATARRHFHRASRMIKTGMFLGLLAFIIGFLV